MKPFDYYPEVSRIVCLDNGAVLSITSVDHQTEGGTFRYFRNYKDARTWVHDGSLEQHPGWHREHCSICRLREMENREKPPVDQL